MSSFLSVFTLAAILLQTMCCLIISWLTLKCKLVPRHAELHEVTLVKLLYLYDPEACERTIFYNYTTRPYNYDFSGIFTTVFWTEKNVDAANFREKVKIWLALHILWSFLGILFLTQTQRPSCFYAALLPFTLTGLALLAVDLIFCVLFLMDVKYTGTEVDILRHINRTKLLKWMDPETPLPRQSSDDTSWIPLLFAYSSCRGVVLWVVNFYIVKDNYFEGVKYYRNLQKIIMKKENFQYNP